MNDNNMTSYLKDVLKNMPENWLNLTTHRLDIYQEDLAKVQFLEQFEVLFRSGNAKEEDLGELPTAFDYIRLGHPLSCILEWAIAELNDISPERVISFSSQTMPILAVLRKNLLDGKNTRIFHTKELPESFDAATLRRVYGYQFELKKVNDIESITPFEGSTIFVSSQEDVFKVERTLAIDFFVNVHPDFGSLVLVGGTQNDDFIGAIQHVRRRESIAMTPADCLEALKMLAEGSYSGKENINAEKNTAGCPSSTPS